MGGGDGDKIVFEKLKTNLKKTRLKYATEQLKTEPRFSIANSTDTDVKQTMTDAKQQSCTE